MKLNLKSFAMAVAGIWAGCVFLVGLAHLIWPSYGGAFLDLVSSIYPGFHPANGFGAVIVGTLYAIFDGWIGGAAFAWLYNSAAHAA